MKKTLQQHFHLKLIEGLFLSIFLFCSVRLSAQSTDLTIFEDDFNRTALGSFWQAQRGWSIKAGLAFNKDDIGTLRTSAAYSQPSYIIETSAKGFTSGYYREFRITFGQANLYNDSMYVLRFSMYGSGLLTLGRSTDNIYNPKPLDEVAVYPNFISVRWYKFKIARYKSGLIQVYVDKGTGYGTVPLLEAIDSEYGKTGHVGWQVSTQTAGEDFYVDWIRAYKPAMEKPAIKEKPVEDNLITQVSANSERSYKVSKLTAGVKEYTDRNYTITTVPPYLKGASFIQTANDDKKNASDNFLSMFLKKAAIVYIGYDPRSTAIPDWLKLWTKTRDRISTTDPRLPYLEVYSKLVETWQVYPYPLLLGGNLSSPAFGAETNYLVAAVERPNVIYLQAEDASLAGAMIANNHTNYNGTGFVDFINPSKDYIEWTVKIDVPGVYNLGFKFANGKSADRQLEIKTDGTNAETISFSSTSSWSSWAFYSGPNVFLTRGTHKIRATATGSSGPNIDELSLYYSSSSDPDMTGQKDVKNKDLISYLFEPAVKAYPNPFVQSTKIYYSLKEKAHVVLSIYSLQGQRVQILVNGIQYPGDYQATFNAGKLSAGTYFYQLQTGNEVKVGKLFKE